MEVPSLDLTQFATPPRRTRAADLRRMLPTPSPTNINCDMPTAPQDVMVDLCDYNDDYLSPTHVPLSPSRKYALSPRARYIIGVLTFVLLLVSALTVAGHLGMRLMVRRYA